jgi:hypothetical protein
MRLHELGLDFREVPEFSRCTDADFGLELERPRTGRVGASQKWRSARKVEMSPPASHGRCG